VAGVALLLGEFARLLVVAQIIQLTSLAASEWLELAVNFKAFGNQLHLLSTRQTKEYPKTTNFSMIDLSVTPIGFNLLLSKCERSSGHVFCSFNQPSMHPLQNRCPIGSFK
jgi:hypothetical protein